MGKKQERETYTQPTLEGLHERETNEIELENCLVLDAPHYKATEKHKEWKCAIHAQPSIFQPDIDTLYTATATNETASQAQKKSLKPGDRVIMKGVPSTQTIEYTNGTTETLHKIALTAIHIISREKRVSTTIYEQQQKRSR